ncbi:MAG: type II toxin-antitoxin system PemK/MazF family toxin [Gemmataceae bacterium]
MQRGEIYFVNFDPVQGSEQHGTRPALVVSNDWLNARPLVILVVPGTTATGARALNRGSVMVPAADSGLPRDTVFWCFQARALDHSRFPPTPSGQLSPERMEDIDEALRFSFQV